MAPSLLLNEHSLVDTAPVVTVKGKKGIARQLFLVLHFLANVLGLHPLRNPGRACQRVRCFLWNLLLIDLVPPALAPKCVWS